MPSLSAWGYAIECGHRVTQRYAASGRDIGTGALEPQLCGH